MMMWQRAEMHVQVRPHLQELCMSLSAGLFLIQRRKRSPGDERHIWAGSFLAINLLWLNVKIEWPNITTLSSLLVMACHNFSSHPFNALCYILPFFSNRSCFISCKRRWYSSYFHNCQLSPTQTHTPKKKSLYYARLIVQFLKTYLSMLMYGSSLN